MLEECYDRGIQVLGLDVIEAGFNETDLPDTMFKQAYLTEYIRVETFDIALCIEVLKQIPKGDSDKIVDPLYDASSLLIATAAPPNQSGTHHFNEQPNRTGQTNSEKEMTDGTKRTESPSKPS
jgi:hypothetical protein